MLLDVSVLSQKEIIFEGKAANVILPGEQGVFEVLPFHKRILSRLLAGEVIIDNQSIPIKRGIVKVEHNRVVAIIEEV